MEQVPSFTSQDWLRFQAGDALAFERLYNEYFDRLYNYGYHYTPDAPLIEDTIQDLFLKLWKNRANLGLPASVKNYLFMSFRRYLIDKLAAVARHLPEENAERGAFDLKLSREAEIISRERQEELQARITAVLQKLTARQREAVFLRYYEDFSYPEIAGIMRLSVKATYKLIGRAMEALRKSASGDMLLLMLLWLAR